MKAYLCFSRKERFGLLGLLMLLGVFIAAPYFFKGSHHPLPSEQLQWTEQVDYPTENSQGNTSGNSFSKTISHVTNHPVRRFFFDPNTVSAASLRQLGFTEKNIKTLCNYRNKGGRFKEAADLKKIWGIHQDLADSLMPYVSIIIANNKAEGSLSSNMTKGRNDFIKRLPQVIDINTADQAAWEQLPGIGPVLAGRILKYKKHLGQFSSVDEIGKTYGLTDSVFANIKPFLQLDNNNMATPEKSIVLLPSINTASEALLIKAGVSPPIASAIVQYRKLYGLFHQLEDLRKIVFIQSAQYEQLIQQVRL